MRGRDLNESVREMDEGDNRIKLQNFPKYFPLSL